MPDKPVRPLTDRERDLLRYIGQGHTTHDIAKARRCSVSAVEAGLRRAYRKIGARGRDHATQILNQEQKQ